MFVDQMQNTLTPKAEEIIYKRAGMSMAWRVRGIGYDTFEVGRDRNYAVVDMQNNRCTCLEWNKSGLPCGHAIVAARHKGHTDCSYLALNYYRSETYRSTYRETIMPAGPPESWRYPDVPLLPCHPPLITKRRAGRPSNNDRRPSQGEGPIQRRCGRCGAVGHTQGECSIPAPSTMPRSRGSSSQTFHSYDLNFP